MFTGMIKVQVNREISLPWRKSYFSLRMRTGYLIFTLLTFQGPTCLFFNVGFLFTGLRDLKQKGGSFGYLQRYRINLYMNKLKLTHWKSCKRRISSRNPKVLSKSPHNYFQDIEQTKFRNEFQKQKKKNERKK